MIKKVCVLFLILSLALGSVISARAEGEITYYVSLTGSDNNSGSINSPFLTLSKAKTAVLNHKNSSPGCSYKIYFREGEYVFNQSVSFTSSDSGTSSGQITYEAYNGENVTFTGYTSVPINLLQPVTDQTVLAKLPDESKSGVKKVNLSSVGITTYGSEIVYGITGNAPAYLELYANGLPQTIARWPNEDFAYTGKPISKVKPLTFEYDHDRASRWANSDTIKLYGAWEYLWYWSTRTINNINLDAKTIALNEIYSENRLEKGNPYFVYNLLEELDIPGEYFVDRKNGILYYYPKGDESSLTLTSLKDSILNLNGVNYVNFKNINFSYSSASGMTLKTCSNINIENCDFTYLGQTAITATEVYNINISGCNIYKIGRTGINISGGDRNTLTPSNSIIQNCDIYETARFSNAGGGCLLISGVGVTVLNNKLHDMPHQAIGYSGNDHVFKGNEVYRVCTMSSDCGAFYTGRDWTFRGIEISENYFHDIYGYKGDGANSVYFDDMVSGAVVKNNLFSNCRTGVFVHGGRDNKILNNMFFNCESGINIANFAGMNSDEYFNKTTGTFYTRLYAVPFNFGVWLERYPEVYYLYANEENPNYPKNNVVSNNVLYNTINVTLTDLARQYGIVQNNILRQMVMHKK